MDRNTDVIVVGSTVPRYKMGAHPAYWMSWLGYALDIADTADVRFFAAIETDPTGDMTPFTPLLDVLTDVAGDHWTFHLDDHAEQITTTNRLPRICTGRNLITEYATQTGASHVLFLDADICPPPDVIPALLCVDYPIVGAHVPTYCLDGPPVPEEERTAAARGVDLRQHMNTAGCLLVARDLFRRLRWRTDLEAGFTDDPCYDADAAALGWPTWVRHDVIAAHYPASIGPLETRGHDRTVRR